MKSLLFFSLMLAPLPVLAAPITVRVVDEAGAPIAGATVQVQRFDNVAPPYAVAVTDAQGVASYELGASTFSPDFYGRVAAWKAGRAVSGANLIKLKDGAITLTLDASAQISGTIEDAKGPVAGAFVQLGSFSEAGKRLSVGEDSPLAQQLSARSDAAGKFTLVGVPAAAKLSLRISDERYASQTVEAQGGGEVSVKLQPGATLRGQVLGLDGAPLVGLNVSAQGQNRGGGDGWAEAKTDAAGNYSLSGLSSGNYNVIFDTASKAEYAIAAREGAVARAGETVEIKTARAVAGVVVRGRVIDATTKAGVPNISVGVYGPARPKSSAMVESFDTDVDGNFAARLLPGDNRVYLMGAPPQWIRPEQQIDLAVSVEGTNALAEFELQPATPIRGRIVDENGKGVKTNLTLKQKWDEWPLQSDENGDFTTYGPKDGELTVGRPRFTGAGNDVTPWELAREQTVSLPPQAPLIIVVKPVILGTMTARAEDEAGRPLAGVKLEFNLTTGKGDGTSSQMQIIFSDANGRFQFANLRSDQSLSLRGVEKSGYDRQGNDDFSRDGNNWSLKTLVLRARNGQIVGRALLADGAPAAGAQIFAAGSETRADDKGAFTLKSLPGGNVEVIAYAAQQFGWTSATTSIATNVANATAAPLQLKLAPQSLQPTDRELAGEMLARARVLAAQTQTGDLGRLKLADADPRATLEALVAAPGRPEELVKTIYFSAGNPDVSTDLLLRTVRSVSDPNWRLYAATMLFAKRPDWPDDAPTREFAASLARDADAIAADISPNKWLGSIGLVAIAPIIEKYEGEAAGRAAMARGIAFTKTQYPQPGNGSLGGYLSMLAIHGESIAPSSPALFAQLMEAIAPASPAYPRALEQGIAAIARNRGLEAAAPFLRQLSAAPNPNDDGPYGATNYAARRATRQVIAAGGASAPALALQLARGLGADENNLEDEGARALAEAAFFQPPAVATALWKEALPQLSADRGAQIAVRAAQAQPALGAELLEMAREKLAASEEIDSRGNSIVASFAFYEAKSDAASARYRLEKAWWKAQKTTDDFQIKPDLVRAMATIDGERAFEWASLIPDSTNRRDARIEALRKAAQYLEASDELRARVDFERWGRGDTVFVD